MVASVGALHTGFTPALSPLADISETPSDSHLAVDYSGVSSDVNAPAAAVLGFGVGAAGAAAAALLLCGVSASGNRRKSSRQNGGRISVRGGSPARAKPQ